MLTNDSCPETDQARSPISEQRALLEARVRRQELFRTHIHGCATCANDSQELCERGYRLLIEALK